jgi:acyl-CoA thioester hydrolase
VPSVMQPLTPDPLASLPGAAQASDQAGSGERPAWCLERRVLPQHTDHAGVMWHGAYLAWLEEARVEALAAAGLAYSDLSARGLELPVLSLAIDYRQALLHGERVRVWSEVQPRRGVKLPWISRFVRTDGGVAAEARVELALVDLSRGPNRRRLLRKLPDDLEGAVQRLLEGPRGEALL